MVRAGWQGENASSRAVGRVVQGRDRGGLCPATKQPHQRKYGPGVRPGFLQLDLRGGWQQHEQEAIEASSAPSCARERAGQSVGARPKNAGTSDCGAGGQPQGGWAARRSPCGLFRAVQHAESRYGAMIRAMMGLFSTRCPYCRSIDFRSVGARNAMERAFHWLLEPCRCGLCGHHFFLFRWHAFIEDTA